jgi:hypothetical protein
MAIQYLINADDATVLRFRNKRSLEAAHEANGGLVAAEKNLAETIGELTKANLQALADRSVGVEGGPEESTNFKTKGDALAAAVVAVPLIAEDGPNIPAPESTGGGTRGRRSAFAGLSITRNTEGGANPRREGSWGAKAWDLIEDGMSFEDYMTKVAETSIPGGSKHLKWDYDRGNVTIQ